MTESREEQIQQWLKKLERESWQLELLVSAFTIFLLLGASETFGDFVYDLQYHYAPNTSFFGLVVFFLSLIYTSIIVLTAFLIIHLLLRGFWIGAIGLRSVQPAINYDALNYSKFFLQKLKKRVIGLDRLVMILDEMCSVIFSLSFLIIFMIISFGLYILFLGVVNGSVVGIISLTNVEPGSGWLSVIFVLEIILILITGLIYLIDYFTLGFFKKYKRISKIYYPIYRFYSTITLSFISRSIYYNLISKYSKKRIRLLYLFLALIFLPLVLVNFDQFQYFPEPETGLFLDNNFYDDLRPADDYVEMASLESKYVQSDFFSLFIRYRPDDNSLIKTNCPDFEPLKNDGFNPNISIKMREEGLMITSENFDDEDKEMLLSCLSDFYQLKINDSIYAEQKFYFHEHPQKGQKGLITVFSTDELLYGENSIKLSKSFIRESDSTLQTKEIAIIPFWHSKK